ncbi:MAG: hypothetical protein K6C96_06440, partial [Butyrivibrio sp.]|nr:hypothetical protein [Butyrivibrio sp.]
MKKRFLSIILASCMSIGLLAGCATTTVEEAGEAAPADAPAATETAAETTDSTTSETLSGEGDQTIHVFLYMQEHEKDIYQKLIDEFVEEHKDQVKEVVFEVTTQD